MGWSSHKLPNKNYQLWTRGGTNGVFIKSTDPDSPEEIDIPSELLRMLVAEDIRSEEISRLEMADTEDLIK